MQRKRFFVRQASSGRAQVGISPTDTPYLKLSGYLRAHTECTEQTSLSWIRVCANKGDFTVYTWVRDCFTDTFALACLYSVTRILTILSQRRSLIRSLMMICYSFTRRKHTTVSHFFRFRDYVLNFNSFVYYASVRVLRMRPR